MQKKTKEKIYELLIALGAILAFIACGLAWVLA